MAQAGKIQNALREMKRDRDYGGKCDEMAWFQLPCILFWKNQWKV